MPASPHRDSQNLATSCPAPPRLPHRNVPRVTPSRRAIPALPGRASPYRDAPLLPYLSAPNNTAARRDETNLQRGGPFTSYPGSRNFKVYLSLIWNVPQPNPADSRLSGRPSPTPTCAPTRDKRLEISVKLNWSSS